MNGPAEEALRSENIQMVKDELRKILKRVDRIFRTVCVLTDKGADDPDLGIGLVDVYTDRNKNPEKYKKRILKREKCTEKNFPGSNECKEKQIPKPDNQSK